MRFVVGIYGWALSCESIVRSNRIANGHVPALHGPHGNSYWPFVLHEVWETLGVPECQQMAAAVSYDPFEHEDGLGCSALRLMYLFVFVGMHTDRVGVSVLLKETTRSTERDCKSTCSHLVCNELLTH